MAEQLRAKILRNLMPFDTGYQVLAVLSASLSPKVKLPIYRAPDWKPAHQKVDNAIGPIFITGRFRTGSTLLWQCFNILAGFTAYYEPFNERQWFDPSKRGASIDASHRGVNDYSANYDHLQELGRFFDINWNSRHLAMGRNHTDDNMIRYVTKLVEAATERPVLQFNRVDFRTEFLKANFPASTLVHLTRNPRDSWSSTLRGIANNPSWNLLDFQFYSRFYLLDWYRDLTLSFPRMHRPVKTTHPYEVHYLVHRLSSLFAARDCSAVIVYEDMETDLIAAVETLLTGIGIMDVDLSPLEGLLSPRQHQYDHEEDEALYQDIETRVEAELEDWLGK